MNDKVKYGRGKHDAHPDYISYMAMIVDHPNYIGISNARSENGRINWQVSSGKSTSFYKDYLARYEWWVEKSDSLELEGKRNSNDRFSLCARLIHPTKTRPCRLCGAKLNIGYFYANKNFAKMLNRVSGSELFEPHMSIEIILDTWSELGFDLAAICQMFPCRFQSNVTLSGQEIKETFQRNIHIPSRLLSPGFMCNPPDRLDGFHDYGLCCRKKKDPGRHDDNMKKYNHDRRVFEWWVGGNWKAADTLYNLAGKGACDFCNKVISKVSPDHIGPLSCGFKHIPFFRALCGPCNSSRNRRMSQEDIRIILNYEENNKCSLASFQIEQFWRNTSKLVKTDAHAESVSSYLRSIQDLYLRALYQIIKSGGAYFLTYLIRHELAHRQYEFHDIDVGTLKYSSYGENTVISNGSNSLETRVIRIAFEEVIQYTSSSEARRKLKKIIGIPAVEDEFTEEFVKISASSNESLIQQVEYWANLILESDLYKKEIMITQGVSNICYRSLDPKQLKVLVHLIKYCENINDIAYNQFRAEHDL